MWAVIWKESESKLMYSGNVLEGLSSPMKLILSFLKKFFTVNLNMSFLFML